MLQTLRNRRNRKGFTLAELLIVVAIIAVLVAIAVPLFVGALNNAEKRVGEANCRAVRAAAVSEILLKNGNGDTTYGTKGPWYAHAKVDMSGEIDTTTFAIGLYSDIAAAAKAGSWKVTDVTAAEGIETIGSNGAYQKTDAGYEILVKITALTIS